MAQGYGQNFTGILSEEITKEYGLTYQIETLLPRSGRIWSLDWSPDDQFIAIGNKTGLVRIYEAKTLALHKILYGIKGTINSVHWSPNNKKIAASGPKGEVMIWDLKTSKPTNLIGHKSQVRNVRWSPSGHFLATTSHDGYIKIWDINYNLVKNINVPYGGCVSIDWLNDNEIGASCWDNTVRVFDLNTEKNLIFANGLQSTKAVLSIDWHPSGEFLTSGDYGNENDPIHNVRFWSPKGVLLEQMTSHTKEIRALSWNPQGTVLATGGETIRIWDKAGKMTNIFKTNMSPIWSLDWNAKGDKIVSGHNDGKVRIWNISGELLSIIDGHSTEITARSFSKDSTSLVLGFSNGDIRLYNLTSMTSLTYKKHTRSITDIGWNHSGRYIAFSSNDGSASIWKMGRNRMKNTMLLKRGGQNLYTVVWSPNDKQVAVAGYENNIYIWNKNGSISRKLETGFKSIHDLKWIDENPIVLKNKTPILEDEPIYVPVNGKYLILVPLNNNRLALFNKKGDLVKGNPEDFIKIFKTNNDEITIEALLSAF